MIVKKVYGYSVFLTGIISFLVWTYLSSFDVETQLKFHNTILSELFKVIIGAIFSYGFFNTIVSIIIYCIEKYKFIKKFFFSSSYIEGIWIGFYVTYNRNEIFLTIEQIDQSIDNISVIGYLFTYIEENVHYHGSWKSNGASFVLQDRSLNYTYKSDVIDSNDSHSGAVIYNFGCQGKKCPNIFLGQDSDYSSDGKANIMCKKYEGSKLISEMKSIIDSEVIPYYKSNKDYF